MFIPPSAGEPVSYRTRQSRAQELPFIIIHDFAPAVKTFFIFFGFFRKNAVTLQAVSD